MNIITKSVITCPKCDFEKEVAMPVDACQYFYECTNCKVVLKSASGECCVFCSYGTAKCLSMQMKER